MERGTLVRWNDDRGFGFIKPNTPNAQDVFIHISTLKQMARKPVVGDEIVYQSQQQSDGKIKATKASIEGVAVISGVTSGLARKPQPKPKQNAGAPGRERHQTPHYTHRRSGSPLRRLITLSLLLGIGFFGLRQYQALNATPVITYEELPAVEPQEWQPATPKFRCEAGKTHCSHMRSCEEAIYYINNCPDTKMDGNHDGVPCEKQWCG
ncbi:excalibur calcium-binding domain-containing protein [Shewanella sp. Isolate8]|uniref:excalibur calcium-binding domain-containing protein n=1 Tax=Shewanella sp. Isolate8 TaxID=2908529 RepID=UPI001EFC384F|nr:excalibur calcium-binding domain-containing protein [Shewanella sp. Isolate8]MCG9747894.1 excalibur calcium-binding domain-containing protein [Shewanella sp. Isolate8]